MIRFIDGPAAGVILELARTPIMLRVVHHGLTGEWDALDQSDDVAGPAEAIYVYRLHGNVTDMHISCRPRSRSRWLKCADYVYCGPIDTDVRERDAWVAWCEATTQMAAHERSQKESRP